MAGTTPSGGGRRRGGGMIVGINVTPMVDVVLVLLVIMMVSATYVVAQSLHVDLPSSASTASAAPTTAIVAVRPGGVLVFNDQPVTEAQFSQRLRTAAAGNPELTLVISGDRAAVHGDIVHVMDLARQEHVTRFAVQVEQVR